MSRIPGIQIEELYAKYDLHPQLMDLYVEGEFDRDFLSNFFAVRGLSTVVSIMTISTVEVPREALVSNSLPTGSNKHLLIALALLFQQRLAKQPLNVSCIVDADQDRLLQKTTTSKHLLYTDYNCMEMYCLNQVALSKFLILTCNLSSEQLTNFSPLAMTVLPTKFCVRALNEELSLGAVTPDFTKGLADRRAFTHFEPQLYVDAFIARNELYRRAGEVKASFERLSANLPSDLRHKSHGHDFVELLFSYAERCGSFMFHDKENAIHKHGGRLLSGVVETADIFTESLFAKIESAINVKGFLWADT